MCVCVCVCVYVCVRIGIVLFLTSIIQFTFSQGCLLAVNLGRDSDTVGAIYGRQPRPLLPLLLIFFLSVTLSL